MATLIENCNAVAAAAAEIDAAIRFKGGTTAGGLRAAGAAISALPTGESHDISLDLIADGRFDFIYSADSTFRFETSTEAASGNTSIVTFGIDGSDLSKWEAEGNHGRDDAKLHIYLAKAGTGLTVQPSYCPAGGTSHQWGSGDIYLFPSSWFATSGFQCIADIVEFSIGNINVFGRDIDTATIQDRTGTGVFSRVLETLRAAWSTTGVIHVANTQSSGLRQISKVYREIRNA